MFGNPEQLKMLLNSNLNNRNMKQLYYQLSDNADVSKIVLDLSGCMAWIESDLEGLSEKDMEDYQYTITPIWLTEEEYNNLPEIEI